MTLQGGCYCGSVTLAAELAQPPGALAPRACDCGYCRKHGAAWLSDPHGRLEIVARDAAHLSRYRQGSGTAQFLACASCGVLVAVILEESGRTWGALNATALDSDPGFATARPVSPRLLEADAKRERWRKLWFADVVVREGDRGA